MKGKSGVDRELYGRLFTIVLPIAFQNLMSSLVTASDTFMLGFLDQNSLSASSLAGQIVFIYSLFFQSFTNGMNVLAAQYRGKGDNETVTRILAVAMRYSLLSGLAFSLAALVFPRALMRLFTGDGALIELGARYLRCVSLSYVLTGFTQTYFGVMKVCGRATMSSAIGSSAVILNILLNACLIFGLGPFPKTGIAGAAWATVAARVFETVCVCVVLARGLCIPLRVREMLRFGLTPLRKRYWHYTLPSMFNRMGWGGGVSMYSVIMGHLGTDATSANAIASIVRSMVASLCWGIGAGVGIIIGGMLGTGQLDRAKKAAGSFTRFSILIGAASGLVILALTPLVLKTVDLTETARGYLKYMMCFASYYIIGNSLNTTVIAGIFPAGGDTRFGMICDITTLWGIVVPLGLAAAFWWHLPVPAVAAILTMDEFVKLPAVYRHYKKYRWLRNLTETQNTVTNPAAG